MTDRTKVGSAIEICIKGLCELCPYRNVNGHLDKDCRESLMVDAMTLLKVQEPRVKTVEEAKACSGWVWAELSTALFGNSRRKCLIYSLLSQSPNSPMIAHLNEDSGFVWGRRWENYGKTWRLWTSRPTKELRKSTPWEDAQ